VKEVAIVFVVSEDRSSFPFSVRFRLIKEAVQHLKNVTVIESGPYLISQATFPTYFLKEETNVVRLQTQLDCEIFASYYKECFNLTTRYIGTEPYCDVTRVYNEVMSETLSKYGIEVIQIERVAVNDEVVSASKVRNLIESDDFEALKFLVPNSRLDRGWISL